jgi:hypothetical protein
LAYGQPMGENLPMVSWAVRCRAHRRKTGLPCGNWAIRGGFVCTHHGGSAQQVRAAADRRWQAFLIEQGLAREAREDISAVLTGLGKVARQRIAELRMEGY